MKVLCYRTFDFDLPLSVLYDCGRPKTGAQVRNGGSFLGLC